MNLVRVFHHWFELDGQVFFMEADLPVALEPNAGLILEDHVVECFASFTASFR